MTELELLAGECRQPDWDGQGARALSEAAIEQTRRFLRALPEGTPAPSLGAEPDGQVTLEWYAAPRRVISVSVSPEGNIHYAALLGRSKINGTEPFLDEVSTTLLELIGRWARLNHAGAARPKKAPTS